MSALDDLIARAEKARDLEAEDKKRQAAERCEAFLAKTMAALGTLWLELEPYCKMVWNGEPRISVEHPDFGCFCIAPSIREGRPALLRHASQMPYFTLDAADLSPLGSFLAERRAEIAEGRSRKRGEQIEQLTRRIRFPQQVASRENGRAYAAETYRALVELAPERAGEWQEMVDACDKAIDTEEELLRRRAAAAEEYRAAYHAWAQARDAALAESDRRFEGLQRSCDTPFHLWELEYAVVARGGDDPYLETRTARVLSNLPNVEGEYAVVYRGEVTDTRFTHVVCIRDLGPVRPTQQQAVACSRYLADERTLYWAPGQPEPDTSGLFVPIPPEPDVPEVLAGRTEPGIIRRQVEAALSGEGDPLNA